MAKSSLAQKKKIRKNAYFFGDVTDDLFARRVSEVSSYSLSKVFHYDSKILLTVF